ncbi:hypothetical protein QWY28_23020 [Nocardioides sp. SOB77]|uniref:ABC-three component systems C-terminal domain-containing protein n=1 Tax=Nocardioides oceani TaxID=3058369 RepID=A0ABT8FN70_9ACTN|nr:ABC-three component system protein [Nocardioides oceani]MDN4175847.1 hypothetical protein [Nocardioides oceani]
MTPQQRIYFYSSDEWEMFIREWATGLAGDYVQIKRLGGPNDKGVDVAAFKTTDGFEGAWDCFQGKHYATSLTLSDAIPEMVKVFAGVVAGHYVMPDRYCFLAPRGCGATLNRLLSSPSQLRGEFLNRVEAGSTHVAGLTDGTVEAIRMLAAATDFSTFQSVEIVDALEIHRKTPYYTARFGGPLPSRPAVGLPPAELDDHETRYVRKLIDVYLEQEPADPLDEAALSSHPQFGQHFQRQRISFYSAEALRLYARDAVPEGTFEALQDDIHGGVIEVAEANHACGMDRLREVLTQSTQLDLSAHALVSVSRIEDRKGICHQLANEDRLAWTDQTS